MSDSTPRTSAVTGPMARALKNRFLWNYGMKLTEVFEGQGPTFPESNAGKVVWNAFNANELAPYLDKQFGSEAVSKCLDYLITTKKDGDSDHAISLLLGRPVGPRVAQATTPAAQAAPVTSDPKVMLAQAYIRGDITIEQFTQAVAALDASAPAQTAEPKLEVVPEPEPEPEAEAESAPLPAPVIIPVAYEPDDDDLPF